MIMRNALWCGVSGFTKDILFLPATAIEVDENRKSATKIVDGITYLRSPSIWMTNIDHGRRHQPLSLMTMADNIKYSRHKDVREHGYLHYDNYDAIEVPYTDAIPGDYEGIMGVPISFLDKYCPDQFEILGITDRQNTSGLRLKRYSKTGNTKYDGHDSLNARAVLLINGEYRPVYGRILIRKKH